MHRLPRAPRPCLSLLLLFFAAGPAHAVLDVEDRGPVLDAGNFRMRVTNAGLVGNAFFSASRSSDPSFEYPAYSGIEMLNHAELWVGAIDEDGQPHVSGGPMLEWRPTLDPNDVVRLKRRSNLGCRRAFDDDGDIRVDEELLNGRDDDGDGEIDEDLGLFADQDAGCEYVDDRPEAINFGYSTGESHHALGLTAYQVASAWSYTGYDGIAALTYKVTNHGSRVLRDIYMGVLADFDSKFREDRAGYRNDKMVYRSWQASKFDGLSKITLDGSIPCTHQPPCPPTQCFTRLSGTVPIVTDGFANSGLPAIGLLPLSHTVDPLTRISASLGRAPVAVSFRTAVFSGEGIPGQGGLPALDADRYTALQGSYRNESADRQTDWVTMVSCGPFRELRPGQSLEFTVAIVAAPNADSLANLLPKIALMYNGLQLDLLPNETTHPDSTEYNVRKTGVAGHELCLEPPAGVTFRVDPDCIVKLPALEPRAPQPITYRPGTCIWTDLDCNGCTGNLGRETIRRWIDPGQVPPFPDKRVTATDHQVTIDWDNLPEVLIKAGQVGGPSSRFLGYRLYKLARWRNREALLPPLENWAMLGTFSNEVGNSEVPMDSITRTQVDYDRLMYEQKHFPVGRYRYVDRDVLNGFDYVYVVTTLYSGTVPANGDPANGYNRVTLESPLIAKFDERVTPRTEAVAAGTQVTVVPNPYRGSAGWDRTPTFGDALPRHIDFMHLPKAIATIRIYTLSGDLVKQLVHDGQGGHGEAQWDLISRNGQDIQSGIYLFTVDSSLGHQVGKFVVVR